MTSRQRPTGPADRALLTLRTVRHLRARQVLHRLLRRFARPARSRTHPGLRESSRRWSSPERLPLALRAPAHWVFLGQSLPVGDASQWDCADRPRLWRYHLHYFDDLRGREAEACADELDGWIDRWIDENPAGLGTGWEPYPLSRRIVSWIIWMLAGHTFAARRLESLALQAAFLSTRLEHDLAANHLFANAKALVFAGAALDCPAAQAWMEAGLKILDEEVREQILDDGGHIERSPMYHAIVLEDLLDLIQLAEVFPNHPDLARRAPGWRSRTQAMLAFLANLTHPDGEIAFFNDSAPGVAPRPGRLIAYAEALGMQPPFANRFAPFGASGYARGASGDLVVLFDAAPVGPDYQPGHAHADTLAFELSLGNERLIVNSGTSTYEIGAQRHFERSTAAHSTVEIDNQDSSEIWAGFRVARRARPLDVGAYQSREAVELVASHDGYARLSGRPRHRRVLRLQDAELLVTDEISGGGHHVVVGRFGLHPSVRLERGAPGTWFLATPSGRALVLESRDGFSLDEETGWYARGFGDLLERKVLRWRWEGSLPLRSRIALRLR